MTFYRKQSGHLRLGQVTTPASDRGLLVGLSARGGHTRRIFHPRHATAHYFAKDSIYIRNFDSDYKADLSGSFDFVLAEIAPAFFDNLQDGPTAATMDCEPAKQDPVLAHLLHAMLPAFDRPGETSSLFIDQLAAVIGTHLLRQYGQPGTARRPRARGLSRAQESLAKAMLREHLDGNIAIAEVAEACRMSRGYFIAAFRQTTGHPPYRWLLSQRVAEAEKMLSASTLPLAEIAIICGFADQSHFTRVFTSFTGQPPGAWRRHHTA